MFPILSHAFKENARKAHTDPNLRRALTRMAHHAPESRMARVEELPEFEELRERGRDIRNHVIRNLDYYLEKFEEQVIAQGGHVHWCATPRQARETILSICQSVKARTCTKGKSMIGEEIALNPFLAENGIEPIETDLGEYIIQLADEPPSHIIGPALHKTKEQVTELFHTHHQKYGYKERTTDPQALVNEARQILRQKYIDADVGITGANFLIAETGSTIIVTNEGNGDLTQMLPKVHIVITSIEKVVPRLEDVTTLLRLLARSATGQEFSSYTTFSTGPKRPGDLDGPEQFHVVLLDNGRSEMLGTPLQDLLRCIRCGACMNHCPVYHSVGGHAYGWVYPGPIGAALDPHLIGLEEARHLPNASTFCGRCESVCPVKIPLPNILRYWREQEFSRGLGSPLPRAGMRLWAWFAKRPWAYRMLARLGAMILQKAGRGTGRIARFPLAGGWTAGRDLPAPEGTSFQAQWRKRMKG